MDWMYYNSSLKRSLLSMHFETYTDLNINHVKSGKIILKA